MLVTILKSLAMMALAFVAQAAGPTRKLAILHCMDARIDVWKTLGLKTGEAHVIRNAGGRAPDAIRSLLASQQLLGTREIRVYHHTDCGMQKVTDHEARRMIKATYPNDTAAHVYLDATPLLTFTDLEGSVREDVAYLKTHPLIHPKATVSGWIYDIETHNSTRIV